MTKGAQSKQLTPPPGLVNGGTGNVSNMSATPGGGVARTLAARASDVVNLLDAGALADNAADISGVFNSLMTSISARSQGGEIFVPDGLYALAAPIILLPNVSLRMSPNAVIRAAASMDAMFKTNVGVSAQRLRRQRLQFGTLKAAQSASRCVWLRDFQQIQLAGQFEGCDGAYLDFGDAGASATCYELFIDGILINRNLGVSPRPNTSYGLNFTNVSDSHLNRILVIGAARGFTGSLYGSQVSKAHVWGYSGDAGNPDIGFYMTGTDVHWHHCQVDNPLTYGWQFTNSRHVLTASRLLVDADCTAADNTIVGVQVDNGSVVTIRDGLFTSNQSGKRIATEVAGSNTANVQISGSVLSNVVTPFRASWPLNYHDGSATGGNALGVGAVDLQTLRTAATQVASGQASFTIGEYNTAQGRCSGAFGQFSQAGNKLCTYALGYDCVTNVDFAWARGKAARSYGRILSDTWGGGTFADNTRLQTVRQLLQATTTTNAVTRLTADGAAAGANGNVFQVQPNSSILFPRIRVMAVDKSGNRAVWGADNVLVSQGATPATTTLDNPAAGNLTLLTSVGTVTGWSSSLGVDTTNGAPSVFGTGPNGTTVHWLAWLDGGESFWPLSA